jgi:CheY-like chemotaxis protein
VGHVLVLEPDLDVRALLTRSLLRLGHKVTTTVDSPQEIDVVLVEPASPDAVAAARAVRDAHPDVPTICASVYPRESLPEDFRTMPHLVKPVPLTQLDRAVRAALGAA